MPIEKTKYEPRGSSYAIQERFHNKQRAQAQRTVAAIRKQIQGLCYDEAGESNWRKDVARDLNTMLAGIDCALSTNDISEIRFAEATMRIVARVAEFEGIRRAGK
jgi:hypothetical protein